MQYCIGKLANAFKITGYRIASIIALPKIKVVNQLVERFPM